MDSLRNDFNDYAQQLVERSFPELIPADVLRDVQLGINEEQSLLTLSVKGVIASNVPLVRELRILVQNFSFYNGRSYQIIGL